MSMALDSARLEPGGQCEAPVVSQARTEARQTRAHWPAVWGGAPEAGAHPPGDRL